MTLQWQNVNVQRWQLKQCVAASLYCHIYWSIYVVLVLIEISALSPGQPAAHQSSNSYRSQIEFWSKQSFYKNSSNNENERIPKDEPKTTFFTFFQTRLIASCATHLSIYAMGKKYKKSINMSWSVKQFFFLWFPFFPFQVCSYEAFPALTNS